MTGRFSSGKMSTRMRQTARPLPATRARMATMTVIGWRSAKTIGFMRHSSGGGLPPRYCAGGGAGVQPGKPPDARRAAWYKRGKIRPQPRPDGGTTMDLSPAQKELRDRLFQSLVEAVLPLKGGADPELTQEMLIEAVGMLKEHLEQELDELRLEQVE